MRARAAVAAGIDPRVSASAWLLEHATPGEKEADSSTASTAVTLRGY